MSADHGVEVIVDSCLLSIQTAWQEKDDTRVKLQFQSLILNCLIVDPFLGECQSASYYGEEFELWVITHEIEVEVIHTLLDLNRCPLRTAQIRLVSSHPEVYEPCDDSFVLADALLADRLKLIEHKPKICLEIGCGSGYVIASLALMLNQDVSGIHYFATDINVDATETTCRTLEAHGIHVEVIATDIASSLQRRLAGMVDVVVVNPPYVPTPEEEVGCEGITAAWAGGENGRSVIDRILPAVDELLSERGWLYMVTVTANNPSQICRLMREKGYASKIVLQRSTQEESLHVIKFWHDTRSDKPREGNKGVLTGSESWLSQLSFLSFLRSNESSG